jgi:uncharacterized protein with HEPN domain
MEKISLKLGDILQLESEINGYTNPNTGDQVLKGFLKQNLSIILKYELSELGETLSKERKKIETLRDELIQKYGEVDDNGGVIVKMYDEEKDDDGNVLTAVLNPKYLEFDKEYGTLLNQEKEIEYPEITKDDLREAGKTNDQYKVLFKLIKKEGAI